MKIGFVLDDSLDKTDGVQQYVLTLGNWLTERGHEVHYLVGETTRTDLMHLHSLSKNIKVSFNQNRLSIPLPANKKRLKQLLKTEHFDVLHVQMPYSPVMAGRVIKLAPKGTAIVGTFHILPFGRIERIATKALGLILRRSLRHFGATAAVSPAARDFAKWSFGIHTQVIPNAVETSRFSAVTHEAQKNIVFLGRLVERKGCAEFIHAVAALPQDVLNNHPVVIAGRGPLEPALRQLANDLKVDVQFIGYVEEADKPQLLANAKVAAFPSLSGESFGIVLIEAMSAGAGIVIGGNNPGYRSVLDQAPASLINPSDTRAFTDLLNNALSDRFFIDELHERQQKLVKQYSVAIVGPKVVRLYHAAIAKQQ